MKRYWHLVPLALCVTASLFAQGGKEQQVEIKPQSAQAGSGKPFEGATISWWTKLNGNVSANYTNLGDTPWAKYVEEQTGIHINFIHPTQGSEKEEFAIMLADGDYPDIIEHTWTTYPGGPSQAIEDGVILNLDDIMRKNAPNFSNLMAAHPDVDKMVKDSNGDYYCFPFLRGLENPNLTLFSGGMIVRKDVLDKLGLAMPETIDDWDKVLRAYKAAGFAVPFCTRSEWMLDCWSGGFDNWGYFYVDDGVVKNGIIEDSRKEMLTKLREWYKDGLIDNDYLVANKKSNQTYFTTGKSAAVNAPFGQGLGNYTQIMHAKDPSIIQEDIRCTVPVTSTRGKNAKFSKMNAIYDASGVSAAISTNCKNKEAAAYLLDWMYSEAGNLACNFGIEGKTYTMVDGKPIYTDFVLNNPDGKTASEILAAYSRASTSGVCVQDPAYIEQYYAQDNQKEALQLSMKTDMGKHAFPPCSVDSKDAERFSEIMSNVETLQDEMEAQFISGAVDINTEWNSYQKQLRAFGIDEAIGMMQKTYDNYMAH